MLKDIPMQILYAMYEAGLWQVLLPQLTPFCHYSKEDSKVTRSIMSEK